MTHMQQKAYTASLLTKPESPPKRMNYNRAKLEKLSSPGETYVTLTDVDLEKSLENNITICTIFSPFCGDKMQEAKQK